MRVKTNGRTASTTCIELDRRQAVAAVAKGDLKVLDFVMKTLSVEESKPKEPRQIKMILKLGDTIIEKEPFDAPDWFLAGEK